MEKSEIEKIYVVRNIDENGSEYVEKFLIQYSNHEEVCGTLPFSYDYLSKLDQSKARTQLWDELVYQHLSKLQKEDYKKIIIVSKHKSKLLEYVNQRIQAIQLKEKEELESSSTEFAAFSNSSVPTSFSFFDLLTTKKRKKTNYKSKKTNVMFRKLKWAISLFILGLGVTYGIKHLSTNLDVFGQKFSFQKEQDQFSDQLIKFQDSVADDSSSFVTVEDATVNVLMEALETNPSVNEQDAIIAQSLRQYLLESPYFDYDQCYQSFSHLWIVHSNQDEGNYGAISSIKKKVIQIYGTDDRDPSLYRADLEHELTHFTGSLDCSFLNEGMTSLIVSEYMEDFKLTNFYYDQIIVTKIMCELITPEKMLEAYHKRDDSIIREELLKINPDVENYYSLLSLFSEYHNEYMTYAKRGEVEEFLSFSFEKYNQRFQETFSNYLVSSTITSEVRDRILTYLSFVGCQTNVTGVVYFNRTVDQPDFIKGYQQFDTSMNEERVRTF